MATIVVPERRLLVSKFYIAMALVFIAIAFGGFFGTYWLQLARGTFSGAGPLLHLHGLMFFGWTLFFLSQATLVANRNLRAHRAWGLFGISLATAMVFTGMMVAIEGLQDRITAGYGEAARAFLIVPMGAIWAFAGFVAAAVANVKRPEWHTRFMLVATTCLLQAPVGRLFFLVATGGGPGMRPGVLPPQPLQVSLGPSFVVGLLVVAAMIHDRRERGRVHPAYWWGFAITTAIDLLRPVVGTTDAWYAVANFLLAL